MDGLKPCPHCGSTDIRIGYDCHTERHYAVCCRCRMHGPEKCGEDDRAIKAWNGLPRRNEITSNAVDCAGCPERRSRSNDHD